MRTALMSDLRIPPMPDFEPGLKPLAGAASPAAAEGSRVDFADLVKRSIDGVNETQMDAKGLAERFELGDPSVDLVRVMVEMQKARVSFEAVSQVRNKFVEAYREIMNMQV
jgi:flagellar hook-basal body complex protein FliE